MADAPASVDLVSAQPRPTPAADSVKRRRRLRIRRWWLVPLVTVPLAVGVGLRQL
ncbi:efflux transporter periplasmic adaptor subunit, partial [filamentous cyanobacterium CCP3]